MRRNMRAERARAGMTAKEVADTIGVSENTLYRWESGYVMPTADNLMRLSVLYGSDPDYLLKNSKETHRGVTSEEGDQ